MELEIEHTWSKLIFKLIILYGQKMILWKRNDVLNAYCLQPYNSIIEIQNRKACIYKTNSVKILLRILKMGPDTIV